MRPWENIKAALIAAYKGKYRVGCKTIRDKLPDLCDPKCPLNRTEQPEEIVIPPEYEDMTLERYKRDFIHKWFWLDPLDDVIVDIIVAAALDQKYPGDPVWLFIVGPPGSLKTELIRPYSPPDYYPISTITAHTLITGLKDETARDLLPELDSKVLIIKDFTTTLTDEANLTQILSQFREAYDGYYEKGFGSRVGVKRYKANFGFITAVTPIIDSYTTVQNLLGERFLKNPTQCVGSRIPRFGNIAPGADPIRKGVHDLTEFKWGQGEYVVVVIVDRWDFTPEDKLPTAEVQVPKDTLAKWIEQAVGYIKEHPEVLGTIARIIVPKVT